MTETTDNLVLIDGSRGEGGGQILRSSLTLAMATGRPVQFVNVRARRPRAGLLAQHLTSVRAAAEVCSATTEQVALRSREFLFRPGPVRGGSFRFDVGTAGSCGLVLQTILPVLLTADADSQVTIRGGTHNRAAPPYDFLERVFLPTLSSLGPQCRAQLGRHGFFPKGGGEFTVEIHPVRKLAPLSLVEPVDWEVAQVTALVAQLPESVGRREVETIRDELDCDPSRLDIRTINDSKGPGNAVLIELRAGDLRELVVGFGEKGLPAERVARAAAREARTLLNSGSPVGEHLADQLLLPLALGAGGAFLTTDTSSHTLTNIDTIRLFLDTEIDVTPQPSGLTRITVSPARAPRSPAR